MKTGKASEMAAEAVEFFRVQGHEGPSLANALARMADLVRSGSKARRLIAECLLFSDGPVTVEGDLADELQRAAVSVDLVEAP